MRAEGDAGHVEGHRGSVVDRRLAFGTPEQQAPRHVAPLDEGGWRNSKYRRRGASDLCNGALPTHLRNQDAWDGGFACRVGACCTVFRASSHVNKRHRRRGDPQITCKRRANTPPAGLDFQLQALDCPPPLPSSLVRPVCAIWRPSPCSTSLRIGTRLPSLSRLFLGRLPAHFGGTVAEQHVPLDGPVEV